MELFSKKFQIINPIWIAYCFSLMMDAANGSTVCIDCNMESCGHLIQYDLTGRCKTSQHGKCFVRKDPNGRSYHGCADNVEWPDLKHQYTGCKYQQYGSWDHRPALWCFCDFNMCNVNASAIQQYYSGQSDNTATLLPSRKISRRQKKFKVDPIKVTQKTGESDGFKVNNVTNNNGGEQNKLMKSNRFDIASWFQRKQMLKNNLLSLQSTNRRSYTNKTINQSPSYNIKFNDKSVKIRKQNMNDKSNPNRMNKSMQKSTNGYQRDTYGKSNNVSPQFVYGSQQYRGYNKLNNRQRGNSDSGRNGIIYDNNFTNQPNRLKSQSKQKKVPILGARKREHAEQIDNMAKSEQYRKYFTVYPESLRNTKVPSTRGNSNRHSGHSVRSPTCAVNKNKKIWVFAFSNDGFPANFFNASGGLEGQSVDLARKVCELAKKDCRMIGLPRSHCWDDSTDPGTSIVLDGKRYDVCANLVENPERRKSLTFPRLSYFGLPPPIFIVAPRSPITTADLRTCNNLTLAFPSLTAVNRDCLVRAGYFVKPENTIPVAASGSIVAAMSEIVDLVLAGTADVGLVIPRLLFRTNEIEVLADVPCQDVSIGLNMMVRVDNQEFLDWWEPTLAKFICTNTVEYNGFCQQLNNDYNIDPLCFTPGVNVDCSLVRGPPLPPQPINSGPIDPCA